MTDEKVARERAHALMFPLQVSGDVCSAFHGPDRRDLCDRLTAAFLEDEARHAALKAEVIAERKSRDELAGSALKIQEELRAEIKSEARAHAAHHARENDEIKRLTAEMDQSRRERDGWERTAAHAHSGYEFYRDIVRQVGEPFGVAARTSDDGSIQDDVLALRVPELVAALRTERDAWAAKCGALEAALAKLKERPSAFRAEDIGQWFDVVIDEPSSAPLTAGSRVQPLRLCDDGDCEPRCGVVTGKWHVMPEHLRLATPAPVPPEGRTL